jgi:hypothetical protein
LKGLRYQGRADHNSSESGFKMSWTTVFLCKGSAMSGESIYVSRVHVERVAGPLRVAYLPSESEPVRFGTHGPIAVHYGIRGDVVDPHATTLDYIVAPAAG